MSEGPLQRYRALVGQGRLKDDPAQRLAVEKLQLLHMRLSDYDPAKPKRVGIGFFGWGRERIRQLEIPGLYLFGGVGRGKSMLMDLFFDGAPVPRRRVHFHAFMQEIHAGIGRARAKGVTDPVEEVAAHVAEQATLLCFDELQITDITDAMIVGRLFEKLFAKGIVVVTTSNRAPDELYRGGLNRELFLPFTALIKKRLELHHLEGPTDHRQARLRGMRVWHVPLGEAADRAMDAAWAELAGGPGSPLELTVSGRKLVLPLCRNGVVRMSFAALCQAPLGPADYLTIAEVARTLLIDRIPQMSRARNNEAKRFVTLVDTLYEAKRRLIASAAAEPETLYQEGEGAFEFERTASRLREMQSADWLGRGA
ncbi:MAG TPA: cell division protein ZapE [Paracoccaceae bacterium]|nr:cell division protein ZapE [Paracoccaceae bacterium]